MFKNSLNYKVKINKDLTMMGLLKVAKKNHDINFSYIVSCNLYGENDNFSIIKGHVIPSLIHKFFVAKKDL